MYPLLAQLYWLAYLPCWSFGYFQTGKILGVIVVLIAWRLWWKYEMRTS